MYIFPTMMPYDPNDYKQTPWFEERNLPAHPTKREQEVAEKILRELERFDAAKKAQPNPDPITRLRQIKKQIANANAFISETQKEIAALEEERKALINEVQELLK